MKKILLTILTICLCIGVFTSCNSSNSSNTDASNSDSNESNVSDVNSEDKDSDFAYLQDKKTLVIGITYFAPMNYKDDKGELTGFETEFAQAVCKKLGLEAKFQDIDWNAKETELNAKNIDCIWNGLTIDDERKATMDITNPYMENKQVIVARNDEKANYTTKEAIKGKNVVAEAKSAGENVVKSDEFFKEVNYTSVDTQAKALLEVKSKTADVAVIDYVMTIGSVGAGTDYEDLSLVDDVEFSPEQYGIAFRKNSPVTLEKVNAAIKELMEDGTLTKIAEKYKLQDLLVK